MKDMPRSAIKWYEMWICAFPESWHPSVLERFYMFVSVLLRNTRKRRTQYWLEKNLREDRPDLLDKDIEKYCDIYLHLRDFTDVWKSHQAKLILKDEIEKDIKK